MVIILAAVIPWLLGFYAVFIVTARFTGLGLFESYFAFQSGSNLGNAVWFGAWSIVSGGVCWALVRRLSRRSNARTMFALGLTAYGVPAALLIFPDTAMGFAVSHVRVFSNEPVPYSGLSLLLIQTGAASLVLAAILTVGNCISTQKRRTLTQ